VVVVVVVVIILPPRLHKDPYSLSRGGGLEDVSKVKKYVMSEEDYNKRSGTLREWIKEQKSANPNWQAPRGGSGKDGASGSDSTSSTSTSINDSAPSGVESVEGMKVGDRCECMPGSRRGTVVYIGEVEGLAPGYWVSEVVVVVVVVITIDCDGDEDGNKQLGLAGNSQSGNDCKLTCG